MAMAMAMASSPHPQKQQQQRLNPESGLSGRMMELEMTIVSAKHLKNVNWRNGLLEPYAVLYLSNDDERRRVTTRPDHDASTKPVWNERFSFVIPEDDISRTSLSLDVFHSKPSQTPKPLVGSLRYPLSDLLPFSSSSSSSRILHSLPLHRPSGRPQGKIRLKIIHHQQQQQPPTYYYYYYPYYSQQPYYHPPPDTSRALPPPSYYDRRSYGGGPSAPLEYWASSSSASSLVEQQRVRGVEGAVGAMSLEEQQGRRRRRMIRYVNEEEEEEEEEDNINKVGWASST